MQIAWAAFYAFASKRPPFKSKEWELPFKTMNDILKERDKREQQQVNGDGPRRLTKEDIVKINKELTKARNRGQI